MTHDELERAVTELQDRQAIMDCLTRYSRGVDRFDRELLLSAYHDDTIDDHGTFVGNPEEFADWALPLHKRLHASHQHALMNHTCELDGDVAHTETYFVFIGMNREGEILQWTGGRYVDRFEKRNGRWAIAQRVCIREWVPLEKRPDMDDPSTMIANPTSMPPSLVEFVRTGPRPRRGRDDQSYQRPLVVDPARVSQGRALRS